MIEAGWYADPGGKEDVHRWWDGHSWTSWLSRDNHAAAPPVDSPSTDGPPADGQPTSRPAVVIGIGVLVLVLGLGALVGVVVLQDRETVTGPAVAPPPPIPSASADPNKPSYDENTQLAEVGRLQATMPSSPFYVDEINEEFTGVAKPAVLAQALVHANFDNDKDWYAACGVGIVDPSLVVDGDIEKTSRNMWKALGENWYVGYPFKEKKVKENHPSNQGADVFTIQGELHYKIKGLASSYDRMSLIVVDMGDGRFGAWFGTRPDDAKKILLDQYQHSLDSLELKPR